MQLQWKLLFPADLRERAGRQPVELPAGQPASLQVWGQEARLQGWRTPEAGVKDRQLEETGIKNRKLEEAGIKDWKP